MMKGRDRNSPCWCGSGIKYKNCHYDRHDQTKDNPWDAVAKNRKAFQQKICSARDVGLGNCDGGVIKAHTVSRGPNLSKIANGGHVMHYAANISEMNKNGGKLSIEKIGISDASVFYGFCRKHDRELFSCIENEPFAGRWDQCLAVAYRTISRERYGKDAASNLREILRGADKGMPLMQQMRLQGMIEAIDLGNRAAQQDIKATFDVLVEALVQKQPNVIRSRIFEFDSVLPFMFAGAWSPFTDLYGVRLQIGYADELLEQIIVSSFAGVKGSSICLSWRDLPGAPGKAIVEQIEALPSQQRGGACLQLVAKHVENIFFNIDWFGSLSDTQRKTLDRLVFSGVDAMGSPPSAQISLDLEFTLPNLVRSYSV